MEQRKFTHEEIEKILQSMDGIRRAENTPFFYTRLQAQIDKRGEVKQSWSFISRPVLAFATLSLLIILNVTAIRSTLKTSKQQVAPTSSGIEKFAEEYDLTESAVYTNKTSDQ